MDSSDFLKKQEKDEDIKLFKEEHPDVYKFIVRLIDGECDSNSGDTILIFSSSFNIKLNMTPQNSKTASEFSKVSRECRDAKHLTVLIDVPG